MKKTYMQPAMLVVKTNAAKMICVSQPKMGINNDPTKTTDVMQGKRRRGIFQDDASEEDQSIW